MKIWSFIGALSLLCASEAYAQHRIAFISDAHIQNIVDYPELVRSMEVLDGSAGTIYPLVQ